MTLKRSLLVWSSVVLLCAFSLRSTARAEPRAERSAVEAEARLAFEAGRDAYEHGEFARALGHFERAYALSPLPQLLFNIGRAADSDGQSSKAIRAYAAYLDAFPTANNVEFVSARLAKLRALENEGAPASRGDSTTPTQRDEGSSRASDDGAGQKSAGVPHAPTVASGASYKPAVITLAALGIASAGLYAGYALAARRGYDSCNGPSYCSDAEFNDAYRKKVYIADAFGAAALAAGTAAGVLFFVQHGRDKRTPSVDVQVALTPSQGKVVVHGTF